VPSLRIIYDIDGWAYHRNALGLQKYAPADFAVSLAAAQADRSQLAAALGEEEPDIVYLMVAGWLRPLRALLAERGWQSPVVACWSVGLPLRMALFQRLYDLTDGWILSSHDYWEGIGRAPRTTAIPFGVDREVFRVKRPLAERTQRVLWVGSEYFRRLKGYDRLILPLASRLRPHRIELDARLVDSYGEQRRSAEEMADWYNTGTVLVCASEAEGTPNPALEAAACGCTVVSTAVGNMPQLIVNGSNGYLVERDLDALATAVVRACEEYRGLAERMQSDLDAWDWRQRSIEFYQFFRDSLGAPRAPVRLDLRDQVTAFVTTVGAPTFDTCIRRLADQDSLFELEVIDHVAPMSAAFQRMLDHCRTPFFVQVDEDMLLYPAAIRTLHQQITTAEPDVAMYCADLYDVHLRRCIQGVKIFRHDVVRDYPFEGIDSFEVGQLRRMAEAGWRYVASATSGSSPQPGRTLGLHGVEWTNTSIYERYLTLMRRRFTRPRNMAWLDEYPMIFLRRFLDEPSEENFFAVQGAIAGALAAREGEGAAKDFRQYDQLPGFAELATFLERFSVSSK